MNFFKINLNKLEDISVVKKKEKQELFLFFSFTVALFVLLFFAFYFNARLNGRIDKYKETVQDLKNQINLLESNKNYISEKDVVNLNKLESKRIFWTKKLESLSKFIGKKISLTEVRYSRNKLYITGIAKVSKTKNNFNLVSRFIEKMKAEKLFSKDFKRIEFKSSDRLTFLDQTILHFEIICYQK